MIRWNMATCLFGIVQMLTFGTPVSARQVGADATRAHYVEVTLPGTEQFDFQATRSGRSYRVLIARPPGPPPEGGYPVVYLVDGNALFPTAYQYSRVNQQNLLIVGIGYAVPTAYDALRRRYDLTPISGPGWSPPASSVGPPGSVYGGMESFMDFIESDLKPHIQGRFPVDRERTTLVGHGLGGLFVLHTLFERPGMFGAYSAIAPSVHWDNSSLVRDMDMFKAKICSMAMRRKLLVVDGEEDVPGHGAGPPPVLVKGLSEIMDDIGSVSSCGMTARLRLYPDENHYSVMSAAIGQSLRLALEH